MNSWAGSPGNAPLQEYWVIRASIEGMVSPETGYVYGIGDIDGWVRTKAAVGVFEVASQGGFSIFAHLKGLQKILDAGLPDRRSGADLASFLPLLRELTLAFSRHLEISALAGESIMLSVTQSFEFSASHRLAAASMTDAENFALFGKCANPNGHGHNYVVDVAVGAPADQISDIPTVLEVQQLVKSRVLDRFDHKYLNLDCPEFLVLNPTVENIARVIWESLQAGLGRRLIRIRVWETPKTYAECDGI